MDPLTSDSAPPADVDTSTLQDTGRSQSERDDGSVGNLDKIRDILFGAELRRYDAKFARLEEILLSETRACRHGLQQRFDALDAFVKREIELLTNRLVQEQAARSGAFSTLMSELATLSAAAERSISAFEGRLAQVRNDLQQSFADGTAQLRAEADARDAETHAWLERTLADMRREKLDRTALATFFREASTKLAQEDAHPVTE